MLIFENLRIALAALRANLLRSILTTLGIIIGVAAVVAVVSIVQGLQYMISSQLQGMGATYVMIVPAQRVAPGVASKPVKLTWDDGIAIRDRVPGVESISPLMVGVETVKYRDRQHRPDFVAGVTEDYPVVNDHTVGQGRFLARVDVERRRKVAVIGATVVDELRLGDEPIGKEIYVGNIPTTIIGIMEERGQALGTDQDNLVFIPYDTALSLFGRRAGDQVQLRLQAESTEVIDRLKDDIRSLLRDRHQLAEGDRDDFQVLVQDEILDTVSSILGSVTAVIGAVVGVALVVGGIGIMNIMLVSVTERTREIGLRKSVGARKNDILLQFLIEAVVLSLLGGAIGLVLGWGIGSLASYLLPGDWPAAVVPMWAVALSFGFCSVVGVAFGIYPAAKAAALDPIEALRYE